ncbi:unnamed protein product [Mytilus coruscus]|uniref:FBXL2_20 n=1 Tax=Mytilus coruscus TaxID=42192 RepID=A0A6J8B2L9_MYTCO|nr:unnamed protein product [Mytilus coruscus]
MACRLKSLKSFCLQKIARNFETFWFKPFEEQFSSAGKLLHVIGPFDDLTSELNQYLLDVLVKEKLLKTKYLQLLISSRLVELNLSKAPNYVYSDGIVNCIADRCHKLTKLNLSYCNKVSSRALENVATQLLTLQILILKSTKCDDKVLIAISQYSCDLRHLDVSSCKISQRGLNSLCSDDSHLPCPKLQTLRIRDCGVCKPPITIDRVASLLLQRTKTFDLDYDKIHLVLSRIHKLNNSPNIITPNLQYPRIQCLDFGTEDIFTTDVELICKYCPNITIAALNPVAHDDQVLPLMTLQHLRHLEIVSDTHDGVTLSFEGSASPLLCSVGMYLQVLLLIELTDVCLSTIGKYCPHLKNFNLMVSTLQDNRSHFPDNMTCYTELEQFKCIIIGENDMLPEDSLSVILKNSKDLRSLLLTNIQFLTTEELGRYINHNALPNLEELELTNCNHIEGSIFYHFLTISQCLTNLTLDVCQQVTRADFSKLLKYSEQHLPKLQVQWT